MKPVLSKLVRLRSAIRYPLLAIRYMFLLVALTGVFLYTRTGTPAPVYAATPNTLNFQARLLTGSGGIVPDGTYNAEFKLYNALTSTGSSQGSCAGDAACVWTETRLTTDAANLRVNVRAGYLSVVLGDKTAFTGINWDQQLYLTMNIGTTAVTPVWDGEMSPRLKLTSVPYAQQAAKANQLSTSAGANTGTLQFGSLSNNPIITLPDATGTVCLQGTSACGFAPSATNGYVQLAPNAVQTDATTNNSIFINKTGASGNILQLQKGAIDVLTVSNGGFITMQPAVAITGGQTHIVQTANVSGSTTGITRGYQYNSTITNTTNAFTNIGLEINQTDNATALVNTNTGLKVTLAGTNTSQRQNGIEVSVSRGFGIMATSTGADSSSACVGNSGISVGVCARSTSTSNPIGLGAQVSQSGGGFISVGGSAVYALNDAAGLGSLFNAGVKGVSSQTAAAAYTSLGVYGRAEGGAGATIYGGYFTLGTTGATLGSALYASNSTVAANILQLQDNTTDVFRVADGGLITLQPSANVNGNLNNVVQTLTIDNTTAASTIRGYQQNLTVTNATTVATTTIGKEINVTDNATAIANTNTGLKVTLSGGNASQGQLGVDVSTTKGVAIRGYSTGASNSGINCGGIGTAISLGVCGYASGATSGDSGVGVYGQTEGFTNVLTSNAAGAGVVARATAAGSSANVYRGLYGDANQSAAAAYTSAGVVGRANGGSGATIYGGYFTLGTSGATLGSAVYASNSTVTTNILQLQDNTTDVLVVGNDGATTLTAVQPASGNGINTLTVTGGKGANTAAGGIGGNLSLTAGAGGNGATTNGNGGNITLQAGAPGAGAGAAGIFGNLLLNTSGGNVGIGDATPLAALTVGSGDLFQVTSAGVIAAAAGITSSGSITFSNFNCTTFTNGGALTANASGVISCSNDDGGAGGGSVSSAGGTANRIAKFTAAQNIEDSSISDTGTLVTVLGTTNLTIQGGTTTIGTTSTLGNLALHDGNGQTTTLRAGDSASSQVFILPTSLGSASQCIKNSGVAGTLEFANCNNGSGGGGAVTLQDAYDASGSPAPILLATAKDLVVTSPDVATDPSVIINLQCTTCSANGGRFAVQTAGTDVLTVSPNGGEVLLRTATNSANGFRIQSSGGSQTVLSANTVVRTGGLSGNLVKIGDSTGTDADTTILQVDSSTANPSTNLGSLNGGLFYNSTSGKLNIVEGGTVKTLCNTTDLNCAVSSGAPVGAAYLTIGNDATLTGERSLTNGTNIAAFTDGGANSTYTVATVNNPTFSGLLTASNTAATALAVTGAPTNSATSSLIQFASAIAGGNSAANGGTYIGLNAPASGAGSVADFLNFQTNGTYKLKVSSTGLVDSAVGFAVAGASGGTVTCTGGQVLSNSVVSGGIITTTGSCITPSGTGASTSLNNLTATSINQSLIANANNTLDIGASATTFRSGYFGTSLISPSLDSAAATSLSVGGTNATTLSIGRTGVTTTIAGSTSLGTVTAGVWNGTAIGLGFGGTGATTAQGAINAISGLTTTGDLSYFDGTNTTRLPRGANGQCLTSNTTTIVWSSCAAGGASSLQGAYDTSGTTNPQILLSSTNGGIKIRDGTTAVTGNLLQLQNNAGTATYFGISATTLTLQDSSGNNALIFDSTTSELKVYGNSTNPTRFARIFYDETASEAVFAASTGTTRVGNGSGDVTISTTTAADTVIVDHTFAAGAAYSGTDFYVSRNITGSSQAITGNVMTVEDLTTFTTGSSSPNVLYVNQNNTAATGNLILAQSGGGANDKFKVTTAGTVIIAAGQSYTGAGAVTLSAGAASALTLTGNAASTLSTTSGALNLSSAAAANWSTSSGDLTIQAGGASKVVLKPGTNSANSVQIQNAAGTSMLNFDSSTDRINVGVSDTTGTLLVLDTKTTVGDPTGVNGAMYYNSVSNTFRCYENSAWADCLSRHIIILGADVVNSNATANTLATALSFPVKGGQAYRFHANIIYTAAATTTGSRWTVTGPIGPQLLSLTSTYGLTATSQTVNYNSVYDTPAASNASSPFTAGNTAILEGIFTPGITGTFAVQFASEIANSAITAKAGSTLEWW